MTLTVVCSLLFYSLLIGHGVSGKCSSDRPGWASHRTLSIPKDKWGGADDLAWVDALCCVYTHVQESSRDVSNLEAYDGTSLEIEGDSFLEIVEAAMAKICSMSMGEEDCKQQELCIDDSHIRELMVVGNLNIDGGEDGWDQGSWRVQVDGVMGGKSTGNLQFDNNDMAMTFSGDIVTVGGGFSSVRRTLSPSINLSTYAGIVIELMSTESHGQEGSNSPPLGVHLQLNDRSNWGYAGAFAVPLAMNSGFVSKVFLPMRAFDRASASGYTCQSCSLDTSSISGVDIYILFQDGTYDLKVKSITAVKDDQSFSAPQIPFASSNAIKELLSLTINSAGYLYNKKYTELSIAVYSTALNSLVRASDGVPEAIKGIACDGLRVATLQNVKTRTAWELRYTTDAILADLTGVARNNVNGWFLPNSAFYNEGKHLCMDMGGTSSVATFHPQSDIVYLKRFNGPFEEKQILDINSSNELGRLYVKNAEECGKYCTMHNLCLSFYFSREENFGGECRLSEANLDTSGAKKLYAGNTFLYDYYEYGASVPQDGKGKSSDLSSGEKRSFDTVIFYGLLISIIFLESLL